MTAEQDTGLVYERQDDSHQERYQDGAPEVLCASAVGERRCGTGLHVEPYASRRRTITRAPRDGIIVTFR